MVVAEPREEIPICVVLESFTVGRQPIGELPRVVVGGARWPERKGRRSCGGARSSSGGSSGGVGSVMANKKWEELDRRRDGEYNSTKGVAAN